MRLLWIYIFLFTLTSCKKSNTETLEKKLVEKMVLVYLAANNDLRFDAIQSLQKIQQGYLFDEKNRLLAFIKTSPNESYLIALKSNNQIDTLYTYIDENSADPLFLKKVISDSRTAISAQTYGLILWSHATSWKPTSQSKVSTKSFGYDDKEEMDLKDLGKYLPKDFEYIIFDACSMASVEVSYELRNHAKYIMASPSEVLSTGFPYNSLIKDLFGGLNGLIKVAEHFMEFYNRQEGLFQSATITLIDTKKLDAIAMETRELLKIKRPFFPFNKSAIQQLTFDTSNNIPSYDFISFLKHNYIKIEYLELENSIRAAVIYKGNTSNFLGKEILDYCGFSIYLPELNDKYLEYYKTLLWSKGSEWNKIF